jgi:hypothetical protein
MNTFTVLYDIKFKNKNRTFDTGLTIAFILQQNRTYDIGLLINISLNSAVKQDFVELNLV